MSFGLLIGFPQCVATRDQDLGLVTFGRIVFSQP